MWEMHTHHTHLCYSRHFIHTLFCLRCFVSCDMHVTPSSLQDSILPSVIEAALSKCTTLEKLTVKGMYINGLPSSITAALLRAVSALESLQEVSMNHCGYGMYLLCVHAHVCVNKG